MGKKTFKAVDRYPFTVNRFSGQRLTVNGNRYTNTPSPGSRPRGAVLFALFFVLLCLYAGCAKIRLPGGSISPVPQGLPAARGGPGPKTNVLLITVDTLRADHLGCYGYSGIQTPRIDGLAKAGIQFTQAYTPVPITLPSHTTIMTGQYPIQTGVRDNGTFRVSKKSSTLAEIFHQQGYRTAAFVSAYVLDSRYGLNQGFDYYDDTLNPKGQVMFLDSERNAEQVTQSALSWIGQNAGSRFFTWIHYYDPHASYHPPSPFAEQYADHPYDGEIAYTDHWIGVLLDRLKSLGVLDNTLVVLTADHGEGLGEHSEKTHAIFIYDATLHVPLILRYPKKLTKAKRIEEFVRTLDIMPTILSIAGIPTPPSCAGVDLTELIQGKKDTLGLILYCESLYPQINHGWSPLEGIRTRDWKYIRAPKPELYHLAQDPDELNNLENQPASAHHLAQDPDELNNLENQPASASRQQWPVRLDELKKQVTIRKSPEGTSLVLDQEAKERLQSLGYVWEARSQESGAGSQEAGAGRQESGVRRQESEVSAPQPAISNPQPVISNPQPVTPNPQPAISNPQPSFPNPQPLPDPKDMIHVQEQIDIAASWVNDGDYEKAREMLAPIAQENPNDLFVHFLLGQVYAFLKEWDLARTEFLQVMAESQKLSETLPAGYADAKELRETLPAGYADAQVCLGIVYLEQGEYERAIKELTESLKENADQYQIYYNLGLAYTRLGQQGRGKESAGGCEVRCAEEQDALRTTHYAQSLQGQALKCFDRAIILKPDQPDIHNNRGVILARQGKIREAIEAYNRAIQLDQKNPKPYQNLAALYQQQKEWVKARKALDQALLFDPNNADLYNNEAYLAIQAGEDRKAWPLLDRGLTLSPHHAGIHNNRGILYLKQQQYQKARIELEQAIQSDPNYSDARYNLGRLYEQDWEKSKDPALAQQAIECYEQIVRIDPNHISAQLQLAGLQCRMGKSDDALAIYEKILMKDPNNPQVRLNLGIAYGREGRIDEAISEYRRLMQLDPRNAEACFNLGVAYTRKRDPTQAAEAYRQAIRLRPQYRKASLNLGLIYRRQGQIDAARNEWKKILQYAPKDAEAHGNLGNLALSQQNFTEAAAEYRKALKADPESVEAHFGLGAAYINLGKVAKAVLEWQETARLDPDNLEARMNLAVAYINQGNFALARTMLSQVLQLNPGLTAAHQLLEKITELEKGESKK